MLASLAAAERTSSRMGVSVAATSAVRRPHMSIRVVQTSLDDFVHGVVAATRGGAEVRTD